MFDTKGETVIFYVICFIKCTFVLMEKLFSYANFSSLMHSRQQFVTYKRLRYKQKRR